MNMATWPMVERALGPLWPLENLLWQGLELPNVPDRQTRLGPWGLAMPGRGALNVVWMFAPVSHLCLGAEPNAPLSLPVRSLRALLRYIVRRAKGASSQLQTTQGPGSGRHIAKALCRRGYEDAEAASVQASVCGSGAAPQLVQPSGQSQGSSAA